jgi:hypothetical protein
MAPGNRCRNTPKNMNKLEKIYHDKSFTHGNNPYELDYERTVRYAEAHSMQNNPILFGISCTSVRVRAPFAECAAVEAPKPKASVAAKPKKK